MEPALAAQWRGTAVPMFATDYNYNLIQLNDTKIILDNKDENSAF